MQKALHGVFVVRLVEKRNSHKEGDHCFVVDGYKGLIMGVSEKELIKLNLDSLRICACECRLSTETVVQVASDGGSECSVKELCHVDVHRCK